MGLILMAAGAGLWWFIVQKGEELEMGADLQRGITWTAYGLGALGALLLIS